MIKIVLFILFVFVGSTEAAEKLPTIAEERQMAKAHFEIIAKSKGGYAKASCSDKVAYLYFREGTPLKEKNYYAKRFVEIFPECKGQKVERPTKAAPLTPAQKATADKERHEKAVAAVKGLTASAGDPSCYDKFRFVRSRVPVKMTNDQMNDLFHKEFPECKQTKFEQEYRITK